jgi:hypothetical protein
MKKHIIIAIAIAITAISANAELTPKQFGQLKDWATSRGYSYKGTDNSFGVQCFIFADQNIFGLVPVSSDTADEAINALIASTVTCREMLEIGKQVVAEVKAENSAKTSPKIATPAATPAEIEQESQTTPTPIEVTANEIYQAYEDNQIVADEQFKDKYIIVTGIVDDIKKDILGNPYVTLETSSYWSVQCMFPKEDIAVLTKLSKGQKVRIAGRVTGTTMNVLLEHCRLVVKPLNQVRTAKQ